MGDNCFCPLCYLGPCRCNFSPFSYRGESAFINAVIYKATYGQGDCGGSYFKYLCSKSIRPSNLMGSHALQKPLRLRVFFVANLLQHGQMSTMVNFRVGLTRIKMSICSSTPQDHGGYTVVWQLSKACI